MCVYVHISTLVVISLKQSEYLVREDDTLSVTITMSDVSSQDVIVEVTVTDITTIGKQVHLQ